MLISIEFCAFQAKFSLRFVYLEQKNVRVEVENQLTLIIFHFIRAHKSQLTIFVVD